MRQSRFLSSLVCVFGCSVLGFALEVQAATGNITFAQQQIQAQQAACAQQYSCQGRALGRRRSRYTMCHPMRNHEVCTPFARIRQNLGYECGPCPPPGPALQCLDQSGAVAMAEPQLRAGRMEVTLNVVPASAPQQHMCILWKIKDNIKQPLARSFQGNNWELYGTEPSTTSVQCDSGNCTITMAPTGENVRYELFSVVARADDTPARFLEQATFGATRNDLSTFPGKYTQWLKNQIESIPPSYHREYYRRRLNHRFEHATPQGIVSHPCQVGTRYRRYAFSDKDRNDQLQIRTVGGTKVFLVDGQIRTVLPPENTAILWDSADRSIADGIYTMCRKIDNYIGTAWRIIHRGTCTAVFHTPPGQTTATNKRVLGVPPVFFNSNIPPDLPVLTLDGNVVEWDSFLYNANDRPQELMVVRKLEQPFCNSIPEAVTQDVQTIVGVYKGRYYLHDSRFVVAENTLNAPYPTGGSALVQQTLAQTNDERFHVACANVAPTIDNEQYCRMVPVSELSSNVCISGATISSESVGSSQETFLDRETLEEVQMSAERYLYVVTGLRQDESVLHDPPCSPGTTSRWQKLETCPSPLPPIHNDTSTVFRQLISKSSDNHLFLRDILFPSLGIACHSSDANKYDMIVALANNECWQNIHPSNYQVYDFTNWVTEHPGGQAAIEQFVTKDYILQYPSSHEMTRWNEQSPLHLVELGRYQDTVIVQEESAMAESLATVLLQDDLEESTLLCGSPSEVANELTLGGSMYQGAFDAMTNYNRTTLTPDLERQRTSIWLEMALRAPDTLRQKVAWILSQLLVVSPNAIETYWNTEQFLHYYDIFVRNALGNYRDVLVQVAYSPLMAEMLSYQNGHSTDYVWHTTRRLEYADENFARELMQLFTIGLVPLALDGSQVATDPSSATTYTNDDVSEYARLWTGLVRQRRRGNIEDSVQKGRNQIDPMRINMQVKDIFPKMGLQRQYVGDGIARCVDLPPRHHLRKGATYRLLGTTPSPRLLHQPASWMHDHTVDRIRLPQSSLRAALCQADANSKCTYPTIVVLPNNLQCGNENYCNIVPRIVEVNAGVYYEYTQPPCVQMSFYNDGIVQSSLTSTHCANPEMADGSVACCAVGSTAVDWSYSRFAGELTTLSEAKARCQAAGLDLCDRPLCTATFRRNKVCDEILGYWTKSACEGLAAKIDAEGRVAIVHRTLGNADILHSVREDTKTFFRVDWNRQDFVSAYSNTCTQAGCVRDSSDNMCVCPVDVVELVVFGNPSSSPPSRKDVLERLKIGAFAPTSTKVTLSNGVIWYPNDNVFEVTDDVGQTQYRKNLQSRVNVGRSTLWFRNPPHFISLALPEKRDAVYEIDAGINHFFYHPNTAPFLALRFLQRFGFSNPSPRFIRRVATAFIQGRYTATDGTIFGTGVYGDLSAMVASILLDRESRSAILDYDPTFGSVLEPFGKLVKILRALEWQAALDDPHIRLRPDLQDWIGQEAHRLPSVFSFFLPEYSPSGPLGGAGLVCPECQAMTGPKTLALLNGFGSLLKYGLDSAYGGFGFGRGGDEHRRSLGSYTQYATGHLKYEPSSGMSSTQIVQELSNLLTAGRLWKEKGQQLVKIYDEIMAKTSSRQRSVILLEQVMISTPEFHTNTIARPSTASNRINAPAPTTSSSDYKAVIVIQLNGGYDSFNLLVPNQCAGKNSAGTAVHTQYQQERGMLALTANERSLKIQVNANKNAKWPQPCNEFVIHDRMPLLKEIYDNGELIFLANTGMLDAKGTTPSNYRSTRMQLFAHNAMIRENQAVDAREQAPGSGVLGRLASRLSTKGLATSSISIDNPSVLTEPRRGQDPAPLVISRNGVSVLNRRPVGEASVNMTKYMESVNLYNPDDYSSFFAQTWSKQLMDGARQAEEWKAYLDSASLGSHWPSLLPDYGLKFAVMSKIISSRAARKKNREFFFVDWPGWDHHADMKERIRPMFRDLNEGLGWLVDELKLQGAWEDVAIVISSDFGRTITGNSGQGSDHAWGGHYWIMGGDVDGGKVVGQYPDDLTRNGPLNIGRGRLIPTTSWDALWNGVADWMGASTSADLDFILPNRNSVSGGSASGFTELLRANDLFHSAAVAALKKRTNE